MLAVFNADDFGCSPEINRAVLLAHREGVLTSASLMVTGDAVEEAVAMARGTPTLAVGLHLVLSDGRPASPPGQIPHLLHGRDRFPPGAARFWIKHLLSPAARSEMIREVRAQFEHFTATGLALDHVNGHQHLHMQPAVFRALLPLARQYGARGVRLPRDDFGLAMRYDRRDAAVKALWAAVFGMLCRRYAGEVAAAAPRTGQAGAVQGLTVADRVYGLMQSGHMEEAYVLGILARAPHISSQAARHAQGRVGAWVVELYFHPTLADASVPLGPNRGDLATLLSPAVQRAIEEGGWVRASYATLHGAR